MSSKSKVTFEQQLFKSADKLRKNIHLTTYNSEAKQILNDIKKD